MPKQLVAFDKIRIETFADTVIGLVLVSMTLRLELPDTISGATAPALAWQGGAYAMSFLVLGIMWVNHRQLAGALDSAPRGFQWLNLNLLFWMSLVPLTTAHVAAHPTDAPALALYCGLFAVASLSLTLLRFVLSRQRPNNTALAQVNFAMTYRSLAAGMIYGAGVPLAFITHYAAWACLVVVPLMFFAPDTRERA